MNSCIVVVQFSVVSESIIEWRIVCGCEAPGPAEPRHSTVTVTHRHTGTVQDRVTVSDLVTV